MPSQYCFPCGTVQYAHPELSLLLAQHMHSSLCPSVPEAFATGYKIAPDVALEGIWAMKSTLLLPGCLISAAHSQTKQIRRMAGLFLGLLSVAELLSLTGN